MCGESYILENTPGYNISIYSLAFFVCEGEFIDKIILSSCQISFTLLEEMVCQHDRNAGAPDIDVMTH